MSGAAAILRRLAGRWMRASGAWRAKARVRVTPVAMAKPVVSSAALRAFAGARKLTPAEQESIRKPSRDALDAFRGERGGRDDWCQIAHALNCAEALADARIASNLRHLVADGQAALSALMKRVIAGGTYAMSEAEQFAVGEALFVFRLQLEFCSCREWGQSQNRVHRLVAAARAGNGGKRFEMHDDSHLRVAKES